jgi:alkaline phosphatase D
MHYRAWAFTPEDNFCRISVDKTAQELRVDYFDWEGNVVPVADMGPVGGAKPKLVKVNRLPLAPWK